MKNQIIIVGIAVLLLIFAFSKVLMNDESQSEFQGNDRVDMFLSENNPSSEVAEAYRFAAENPGGVLDSVPCYCGCMETNDHLNNRDCFIEEDGEMDEMGLNCGVCVKTALKTKELYLGGKDLEEINKQIDLRFKKF